MISYVRNHCNTFSFEELPDYGKMNVMAVHNERLTEVDDIHLSLLSTWRENVAKELLIDLGLVTF